MAKEKNRHPTARAPTAITGDQMKSGFAMNWKLSFLLGLIAVLVYANTYNNGYVLDDINVIRDNSLVKSGIQAIPKILATPYRYGWAHLDNDLYRPLSVVTFAIEYQLFGQDPRSGHFFNIILFAGCVIVLFLFLHRLFAGKKTAVAFIAALLFALHPIHTEVAANIKSRDELFCFFFGCLCLLAFMRYARLGKIAGLLSGSLFFLLALLSKETVITFLAIIPLVFFFYENENRKRSVYIIACTVLVAVIFLIARFSILNAYHAGNIADNDMIENALANTHLTFESRMATAVLILGYYARLLFMPYPLSCDYSYNSIPYAHFNGAGVLISLLFYVFLIVFSVRRLLKNKKDPYAFGIIFFLISISLFSNILFLIGSTMAERFAFFGSAGFCLVIALFIEQWIWRKEDTGMSVLKNGKVQICVISIGLIYAAITINRNGDWVDDYTLFKTDLAKAPDDARLNYYLGDNILTSMLDVKDPVQYGNMAKDVVDLLKKAIAIYPDYKKAHADIGNAYLALKEYDSAIVHYERAVALQYKSAKLLRNLARVYSYKKDYRQAIRYNEMAISIDPHSAMSYANAGLCYQYLAVNDSAIYYAHRAIATDPSFVGAYQILGAIYKTMGQTDSMIKYETLANQYQQ